MCGFISGLSILFHLSIFLFLCQYHPVLMTVALQYSLVRKVDSSHSILLSEDCFGYLRFFLLCVYVSIQIVKLFILVLCSLTGIELNLQCFGQYTHFHYIDSSSPGTWYISTSICVIFDFFHQCFILLHIYVFCFLR